MKLVLGVFIVWVGLCSGSRFSIFYANETWFTGSILATFSVENGTSPLLTMHLTVCKNRLGSPRGGEGNDNYTITYHGDKFLRLKILKLSNAYEL